MNDKQRRSALFVMLAGVLAWSAWLAISDATNSEADTDVPDIAEPIVRPKGVPTALQPARLPARQGETTRLSFPSANLFPRQTWYVPPPPPPPPPPSPPPPPAPPPPPPQAPSLPFTYMGRWQDAGQTTYYLSRGAAPVSVREGDVLDGVWRLERVAGDVLNFTYLPLNQTRTLRAGD